jgi:hypothetical protein
MEITEAIDVVFRRPFTELPSGGMMTRRACGSTTSRKIWNGFRPSARAASLWPLATDRMPPRRISDR